jgi:hemolysin activation/secretion protein
VIVPGGPGAAAPPKGAAEIRFTLRRVDIQGGTVYREAELATLFHDKIGRNVSVADIYALAEAITAKYRNDGYLLSQALVPPQQIGDGVVRLRIVEGFVQNVTIVGGTPGQTDYIKRIADKIAQDFPLRSATIERYLLLINDLAGVTATGALKPARTIAGAADLIVTVSQKMFDGNIGFDNRASRYFGNYEVNAGVGLNSALGEYERFSARFLAATTYQTHYTDLGAELPVGTEGLKLRLRGLFGNDHPGASLTPLDVHDSSYLVTAGAEYPIIRSRLENLRVSGEFDISQVNSDILADATHLYDRVRPVRLTATYDIADTLTQMLAVNLVSIELSQGINFLGATEPGPLRTRTDGRPDFTKANMYVSRDQPIRGPFSLELAAAAQLSSGPLFFSEAFGIGGPQFGRAYDPSEILGDSGAAGSAELRYTRAGDGNIVRRYQLFAYYDGGAVWNDGALQPGLYRSTTVMSTGFGVRLNLAYGFAASGEVDFPLTRNVQALGNRDPRFFFSLAAQF